jgi:hypothetical protein
MYTTVNEDGLLNNYAPETPIYYAEYPAIWEQRRYVLQGAVASLFVSILILASLAISCVG